MPDVLDIPNGSLRRRLLIGAVVIGSSLCLSSAALAQRAEGARASAAEVRQAGRAKPFTEMSASALAMRDSLVRRARAQIGRRYVLGGTSPDRGFDCSGLVKYVMAALKVDLPRTAARQALVGNSIGLDTAQLQPGDLLAFGRGRAASHIGIYVGNGRYVHASSVAGRVIESKIDRPQSRLVKRWRDSRRVVPVASDTLAQQ